MLTLSFDECWPTPTKSARSGAGGSRRIPDALAMQLQPGGRFATVGALVDHIFLVEARHLARLQRQDGAGGVGHRRRRVAALFGYGAASRRALRQYLTTLTDADAATAARRSRCSPARRG